MAREFDLSQTLEARANPSRAPKTFLYELSRLKEQVGWLREEIARLASEAKKIFLGFENLDDNMWRSSYKASPIDFFRSMEENIDKLSKEFAETSAETERFHSELLAIMAGRAVGPSVPLSLTKSPEQMRLVDDDEPIN